MKIILLQDVRGIGRKYDIKEISNGYARNFLLPRNLAKIASKEALKELEAQKRSWEKQTETLRLELKKIQDKLVKNPLIFKLKIREGDKAFGSITKKDIEEKLDENIKVNLKQPIKTLGEHEIEIDLEKGVVGKIKIRVEKES